MDSIKSQLEMMKFEEENNIQGTGTFNAYLSQEFKEKEKLWRAAKKKVVILNSKVQRIEEELAKYIDSLTAAASKLLKTDPVDPFEETQTQMDPLVKKLVNNCMVIDDIAIKYSEMCYQLIILLKFIKSSKCRLFEMEQLLKIVDDEDLKCEMKELHNKLKETEELADRVRKEIRRLKIQLNRLESKFPIVVPINFN